MNINKKNYVHGFKVFRGDWTCCPGSIPKQYTCPGKFEEEGEIDVCGHGMHFCKSAADCFSYYSFDSNNKVAEVIAYGKVLEEGNKCCTDKLEIVRELPWSEVLQIVNVGKNCTGRCNIGNGNAGNYNTGYYNTDSYNTGDRNTGRCNTGDWNTGNCNTGDYNTGRCNTGNYNTGDYNTGNWNTGDYNTGNWNTGDWNAGNYNTGCFMTISQKIMLFNKPSDWTYTDWLDSEARELLKQIPRNLVKWIPSDNMTDEEKAENLIYKATGGYLKVLDESECGQLWWNSLSEYEKGIITTLPNFDPEIFEQCTGIKVDA